MRPHHSSGSAVIFGSLLMAMLLFPILATVADADRVQAALKGTWQSVCMDLGSGIYTRTTKTYDGAGKATSKVVFYSDAECSKPTGLVNTGTATYVIGKKVELGGGQEAYAIDVTIVKFELSQSGSVIKSGGPVPTQYDVIAIDGDKLYNSGLTRANKGPILDPSGRPTTLDKTNIYKRQ